MRLGGRRDAVLVVDDTALPKKGRHSVGVAPQYATSLGKNANCQTLACLTLASAEVPVMIGLRLFPPESWTSDAARMTRAQVPPDQQACLTKPEIAVVEIDRARAAGVRSGCVLADAGYGLSAAFRQALSERGLRWAVGTPRHQKVYPADVALVAPVADRERPRRRHIPDSQSVAAEKTLAGASWRKVSWRRGTKGRLSARFALLRMRVADGPTQRLGDQANQHMPGEEVWLVGEHHCSGERKHTVSNLPAETPVKVLVGAIKARWVCEQAHQQLKEELGLNHFEGRSWIGLHRHALMTMMTCAFLQTRRLAQAGRKEGGRDLRRSRLCPQSGRPSSTSWPAPHPAAVRTARHGSSLSRRPICQSSARGAGHRAEPPAQSPLPARLIEGVGVFRRDLAQHMSRALARRSTHQGLVGVDPVFLQVHDRLKDHREREILYALTAGGACFSALQQCAL